MKKRETRERPFFFLSLFRVCLSLPVLLQSLSLFSFFHEQEKYRRQIKKELVSSRRRPSKSSRQGGGRGGRRKKKKKETPPSPLLSQNSTLSIERCFFSLSLGLNAPLPKRNYAPPPGAAAPTRRLLAVGARGGYQQQQQWGGRAAAAAVWSEGQRRRRPVWSAFVLSFALFSLSRCGALSRSLSLLF